ncbi:putative 312 protein [Daphnia magna]|uniref:Mitochondrial assembly of ribosomal large subunit protein 1 n=2 Tax=Daphnia magna TaxID=35525 RepID=A0A164S276_9CRUS|nr:putative 312 protein [Daphnia magna]SVE83225.1 EOG090X0AI9 [Daphnia magna]
MWRQFSLRALLTKESCNKSSFMLSSQYERNSHRVASKIWYRTYAKINLCHTADRHAGASLFLTFSPTIMNSHRKYTAELVENKSEEKKSFDEDNWQRIGDSETVEEFDEFQGISLQRGTTGIFDIEEFVEILNQQKLQGIVVIAVPSQLNYVDYMVITTGRSPKQMTAVAEFLRKLSKRRCLTTDPLPVIEGKNNKDWIALDLGNIALHIFSSKVRKIYDLETLWTCGPDFDDLSIEKDILTSPMNSYTFPSQKSV